MASTTFVSEFGTFLNNVLTVVVLFIGFILFSQVHCLLGPNWREHADWQIFSTDTVISSFAMKNLSQMLENFASAGSLSSKRNLEIMTLLERLTFKVFLAAGSIEPHLSDVSFAIGVNETVGICR